MILELGLQKAISALPDGSLLGFPIEGAQGDGDSGGGRREVLLIYFLLVSPSHQGHSS